MSTSKSYSSCTNKSKEGHSQSSNSDGTFFSENSTSKKLYSEISSNCDEYRSASSTSFANDTVSSNEDKCCNVHDVVEHLTTLGTKEQLLMFLTGPAGAGKTTAVKLEQQFCF